jgi:hypothetical protein
MVENHTLGGLGGPEIIVIAVVFFGFIFFIGWVWGGRRNNTQFSRYCPKCGRGLRQPEDDAPCCAYCGEQLP